MRILLLSLVLLFSIAAFGQDAEDLNRCVTHEWMGNRPAFFELVPSASIEEIKSKKQNIQFNKLTSYGRSVLFDVVELRVFNGGLPLIKFLVENGALIDTEDEDLGSPVSKKMKFAPSFLTKKRPSLNIFLALNLTYHA